MHGKEYAAVYGFVSSNIQESFLCPTKVHGKKSQFCVSLQVQNATKPTVSYAPCEDFTSVPVLFHLKTSGGKKAICCLHMKQYPEGIVQDQAYSLFLDTI